MLFYPCIIDSNGKIRKKVTKKPMSKDDAETFLKTHYMWFWRRCEAIPQPETMDKTYLVW